MQVNIKKHLFDILSNRHLNRLTQGLAHKVRLKSFFKPVNINNINSVVLSFDLDYEEDVLAIDKVLNILEEFSFKAVFACVGLWIKKYPHYHKLIVENGHEIINHTYSHPDSPVLNPKHIKDLSDNELLLEIKKFNQICNDMLSYNPLGFRTPHFGPQHRFRIYQKIKEAGLLYDSSINDSNLIDYMKPLIFKNINIIEFPLAVCPHKSYASFDSFNYFTTPKRPLSLKYNFVEDFHKAIKLAYDNKAYRSFYFDPQDFAKRKTYKEALYVLKGFSKKGLKVTTYSKILSFINTKINTKEGRGKP